MLSSWMELYQGEQLWVFSESDPCVLLLLDQFADFLKVNTRVGRHNGGRLARARYLDRLPVVAAGSVDAPWVEQVAILICLYGYDWPLD